MTWTLIWVIGGAILFFCGYKVGHHNTMARLYREHKIEKPVAALKNMEER